MRRRRLFVLTLLAGVAVTAAGFLLSMAAGPAGTPAHGDPRMPFAPLLFIIGLALTFGSAVVYEITHETQTAAARAPTPRRRSNRQGRSLDATG